MLSLRVDPIKKNTAKYYFSEDNYYYTGELSTHWLGISADKLHLAGEVDVTALESVLGGILPNGEIIGLHTKSGEIKHRGGYDLTFSAPKSVSYLALVAGDKEFITLHQQAVQKVLGIIEQYAAEARKSGKEGIAYENTGNLCFANILHDTSREQDPHLHTHALLMNLTERCDGKWRALASDISRNHGTMEWIMGNQIFLGLVYRSEIALGLKGIGLEIEHTGDAHGLFEIKHFSQPLLDKLSKRRTQIEAEVQTMHSDSLKAYDRATKNTRREKEATDPVALRDRWCAESESLGINPSIYLEELKQHTAKSNAINKPLSKTYGQDLAVQYAIAHLEEKKLTFSYQDILQTSLYFSLGDQGIDELIKQLDNEINTRRLIAIDDENKRFTTPGLISKERLLIEQLSGFKQQKNMLPSNVEMIHSLTENESIKQAIMGALEDKSGVVRIRQQGASSREVLKILINYTDESKKIRVLSPSSVTTHHINQEKKSTPQSFWQWIVAAGKPEVAQTIAGFNYQHKHDHSLPFFSSRQGRELLIVDDVQRLSPDDMNTLISIASRRSAKVILLEKQDGLAGFKSDMSNLLDKARVKTFQANDRPQRTATISLIEAGEKDARIMKTAEHYTSLSKEARQNTRVLAVSKSEAREINQAIRIQLKAHGEVGIEEKTMNTLTNIALTQSEKKFAKSYKPDWVLIHSTRSETRRFTILSIEEKDNRLRVRDEDGVISHLRTKDIGQSSFIYEKTPLSLSIGEKLMATGSLVSEGIKAGTQYDVSEFTRFGIKLKDGKKTIHLALDGETHLPLTHAYATTVYAADLKPMDNTILNLPAYALRKNTLAIMAENSKKSLVILTDDVRKAERYTKKSVTGSSAISLTLDAAQNHCGLKVLDDGIKGDLLQTLDKALDLLVVDRPKKSDSEKALQFAIAHLSEREAAFSSHALLEVAITKAIGYVGIDELTLTMEKLISEGHLIAANKNLLTTSEAVNFETLILDTVKDGRGKVIPLLSSFDAHSKLSQANLTQGQRDACILITTSPDRFAVIQGYAGTGKTTMTRAMIDAIDHASTMTDGVDIVTVAPTHQAVKEMKALGIASQTLKSFLIEQSDESTLTSKTLVLLDESSMVSNRDFASLVQLIHNAGARCVILGDISQHQSIESGKPSKLIMQDGNVPVVYMDHIVRQQVADYKKAVETLVKGSTDKALSQLALLAPTLVERNSNYSVFKGLKTSVITVGGSLTPSEKTIPEIPDELQVGKKTLIEMAVFDYLSRTKSCRDDTVVIIHENKNREIANHLIRNALVNEGALGPENQRFLRLLSTNYTTAELYYTQTYQDCLKGKEAHFLKKDNEYYEVVSVNADLKIVNLKDKDGNATIFMPEKDTQNWRIELFKQVPGNISVGEKIHFKKTDKSLGRFANERAEVVSVSDSTFTLKDSTGNEHILSKKDKKDSHWDYSYTATSYSIQGASFKFVIGVADTSNKNTSHFRSFYIMVSRGSLHAMIYTDDYEKLEKQISMTPDKTSALEALGRVSTHIKPIQTMHEPFHVKASISHINQNTEAKYDVNLVGKALNAQAEHVIESLLGEPNAKLSSNKEYRYGSNGSLSLCLHGEKRGTWFNFETNEKGNLFHLIQSVLGLNFKSSLQYAAELTNNMHSKIINHVDYQSVKKEQKISTSTLSKTQLAAQKIARESVPVTGTLAEKYLKEVRGIKNVTGENLRFHPNVFTSENEVQKRRPAMIGIVRNKENDCVAIEIIYLDEKTANKASMNIKPKKTLGPKGKGVVILDEGLSSESVTYIVEGIETALSIRDAVRNERVIATLGKGNFNNIDMEILSKRVVLCLDNDGKNVTQDKVILDLVERLVKHEKEVVLTIPHKKGDFNDIARAYGTDGVVSALNNFIKLDKIPNAVGISDSEIKSCIKQIDNKINLRLSDDLDKNKTKVLLKIDMEI